MKSDNACKARGLSDGRIYTRVGKLVASVAQEGLIRYHGLEK
jgi:acyl-CoA thioesterase-2